MSYNPRAHGARCDLCPLNGKTPVPPSPPATRRHLRVVGAQPTFVVIGEAPGRMETWRGEPFVGPSGKLLNKVLKTANLPRHEAWVTNALLCRPDDDTPAIKLAATSCCAPRLAGELEAIDPKVPILAMGAWGARAVLGVKTILKSRGFIWETEEIEEAKLVAGRKALERMKANALKEGKVAKRKEGIEKKIRSLFLLESRAKFAGRTVIPTLHPAFILRGADCHYPLLVTDARRFRRVIDGDYELEDKCKYTVARTPLEVLRQVKKLREINPGKGDISLDVETTGKDALTTDLKCIGLSDGERTVVIYPWKPSMAGALGKALKGKTLVMHNGPQFDHLVLGHHNVPVTKWEDTLLAHHAFASHLPKSLSHVVSVFCDSRPWKILSGKDAGAEKGVAPWEAVDRVKSPAEKKAAVKRLLDYNAADVRLTALAWRRMQGDLEGELHTYQSDKRIALMCQGMTKIGIGFDSERASKLGKALRNRKRGLLGEMRKLVGSKDWHPARLNDIRWALFTKFRAPLLRPTKTGLASTSNETLEYLKTRGVDTRAGVMSDLVLRWRGAAKAQGTYVEGGLAPATDGRVHPSWKLGPVTGRLAGALMTLPRYDKDPEAYEGHIRGLYVARPSPKPRLVAQVHDAAIIEAFGEFFYYDLSQAEARLAAYFSGDENLIAACEADIHSENAKVAFSDIPEAAKLLARANEVSPFFDAKGKPLKWKAVGQKNGGCKEFRDVTKNVGFCVWYKGTAERAYITLASAGFKASMQNCERFVSKFHQRYAHYYSWCDENVAFVREHGYFRTILSGRIRWLGWHAKETEIYNFPIQSGIADLQNDRLPRIEDGLKNCKDGDDVVKLINNTWAEPILVPHNGKSFVMPIDVKDGVNWGEAFG